MKAKKFNSYNKILIIFLFSHLFVWILVPTISNGNLPLDTIEALAWGSNLDWGFNKHPPLSAFAVEVFYRIFGNQDWAYYFLSQLFVVFSFFIIFIFSKDFFKNQAYGLISIMLLEGIYFYNFTTPEFNVNVSQLPFCALSVLYCWRGCKNNKTIDWLLFGLFAGLGVLSKYLFIYLLVAMDVFFIYLILNKKINYKCLISLLSFFVVLLPHLMWLVENNYATLNYAFHRTGLGQTQPLDHIFNPIIFLGKQLGVLIPFFIMLYFSISKFNLRLNFKDRKFLFLFIIVMVPIILMFLTSLFTGAKIRTMWMTPFYLFIGIFFVYIFQNQINLNKIKYFLSVFLILFIFSPAFYYYVSETNDNKRTDYPGKEISELVQSRWNKNFTNTISIVVGDEWYGGNLSYHLKSRPKWFNENIPKDLNFDGGVIYTGSTEILKNFCPGLFGKIKFQGICMIGTK